MNKVCVTGIGLVSSLGFDPKEFYFNLLNGKNGISDVTLFNTNDFRTNKAGEVKNIEKHPYYLKNKKRILEFIGASVKQAIQDSGLEGRSDFHNESIIFIGSTIGTVNSVDKFFINFNEKEKAYNQEYLSYLTWDSINNFIRETFNIFSRASILSTVCASSSHAIALGTMAIKQGKAKIAIVGGVEILNIFLFSGFDSLRSVSPEGVCAPFSNNRNGLVMGEGAGILILEEKKSAQKRDAKIYSLIEGFGISCDAYHIAAPHPEGDGVALAISDVLQDACINPEKIDYFNAHGTGTKPNDSMETKAIKKIWGQYAYGLPISSIKSMVGHTMGAAGVIEAIATILTIKNGIIPPTINYKEQDPKCDLNYVPNKAIEKNIIMAISSSSGFGGNNSAILFKKDNT